MNTLEKKVAIVTPMEAQAIVNDELTLARRNFDRLGENYPKAPTVAVQLATIAKVPCYWLTPEGAQPNRILLYLHGGAFAAGSIRSHGSLISHIAQTTRLRTLFIDYALAPEHPFPAGIHDVMAVYRELLDRFPAYRLDVMGDSAGGGLAISAVSDIQRQGLRLPQSVVLISPWVDLLGNNPSYETNREADTILTASYLANRAALYAGGTDLQQASPINAPLTAISPVLIQVGSSELLLDDSRHLYAALRRIQPQVTLTVYPDQQHVWLLASIEREASQNALAELTTFLNETR